MKDGYPEDYELRKIQKWKLEDTVNLLDFIESIWWTPDWGFIKEWGKDHIHNHPVINLALHTGGWSGNEEIMDSLLKNMMFKIMFYSQWNRGGHYKFEIDPQRIGYKLVSEFCKENNVSRQYVWKYKEKYEWLKVSKNKKYIRLIK
jgi:hypothetical protein